ncbi:hypothetical protein [Xanthobacter pseudotagetidis]|uniref:hypothetical protein n=1 Tax=Xanthobacter pseudotagetidis TaxID=3119911 RepID=UPI003729A6D7
MAQQQVDAELLLQILHLLAERGLGNPEDFGCPRKIPAFRDLDEVFELPDFHDQSFRRGTFAGSGAIVKLHDKSPYAQAMGIQNVKN